MPRTLSALLSGLLLAAFVAPAAAQEPIITRSLRLAVDNDLFAVGRGNPDDHDYTHGTRLIAASAGAPRWMRALLRTDAECTSTAALRTSCVASSLEIAQEIFTPRLDGPTPVPGERPYSGWLFGAVGTHLVSERRVRSVRVEIGVTGPQSLAEQAQDGVHALLDERQRRGWANQLGNGVGYAVSLDDRITFARRDSGSRVGSAAIEYGLVAGNVRVAAHIGVLGRIGLGPRAAWSPAELTTTPLGGFYVMGGARQYFVARDLFVEGDEVHPGGDRLPIVQELLLGAGVRRRGVALEYRWVLRGREYQAQERAHGYGSFLLSIDRL